MKEVRRIECRKALYTLPCETLRVVISLSRYPLLRRKLLKQYFSYQTTSYYLQTESLQAVGQDLGDIYPRKVIYFPLTGRVKMKKLKSMHNDTIVRREVDYLDSLKQQPVSGDVELF